MAARSILATSWPLSYLAEVRCIQEEVQDRDCILVVAGHRTPSGILGRLDGRKRNCSGSGICRVELAEGGTRQCQWESLSLNW